MGVGNLISAFSKSSLNICKFSVHMLLKPRLKDFEHYLLACKISTVTIYNLDLLLCQFGTSLLFHIHCFSPYPFLTVASWPAYRFPRRQFRWTGIPISWRIFHNFFVIHTVKNFGVVNKAEIDVFLELSCFFHDPADVGNLISGSLAFSKTSLNNCMSI